MLEIVRRILRRHNVTFSSKTTRGSRTCPQRFWCVMLLTGSNRYSASSHGFNRGSRALRRLNLIRRWQHGWTQTIVWWNRAGIVWRWQWLQQTEWRHTFKQANSHRQKAHGCWKQHVSMPWKWLLTASHSSVPNSPNATTSYETEPYLPPNELGIGTRIADWQLPKHDNPVNSPHLTVSSTYGLHLCRHIPSTYWHLH